MSEGLAKAIDGLTEKRRRVLMLRYAEERSFQEIAVAMNLSEAAARKHLHDARKQLKMALFPDWR